MLGLIKNVVLDCILYFFTESMRKYRAQHKIHDTSFKEVSKKYLMINNLQPLLHTKNVQNYYNEK